MAKVIVALYIRGDGVDPDAVTRRLGVTPGHTRLKGEKLPSGSGKTITARTGIWAVTSESESDILSDHVDELVSRLTFDPDNLRDAVGAEEGYFDIFVCQTAGEASQEGCYFELNSSQLAGLAKFGLPVRFTAAVTEPD